MTKKAQIIIAIMAGITIIAVVITANLLLQSWLDNVRQDAFEIAKNRIVNNILAGIEQKGEVVITVPDGSVVLVPKEINK